MLTTTPGAPLVKILAAINGCIKERAVEDTVEEGENSNNHLLDDVHTHIGIGVFVLEEQLRYVEVSLTKTKRIK